MTRHGPLTAQGLGRSPYDAVFQGTGDRHPPGPIQQYDERGRPTNPETRRINRNVVRSHNEVMQVIGVAEPDTNTQQTELDDSRKRHDEYEDDIGKTLLAAGQVVYYVAICASNGLRYRNLLYKPYQSLSLVDLFAFERSQRPLFTTFFAGYPTWATILYLQIRQPLAGHFAGRPWLYTLGTGWIQMHLSVFGLLQHAGVIPASQILPSWRFFVPFIPGSLIAAPTMPTSLTTPAVLGFCGQMALNAAPVVLLFCHRRFSSMVRAVVWEMMYRILPRPTPPTHKPGRPTPSRTTTVPPPPEEIELPSSTQESASATEPVFQGFSSEATADTPVVDHALPTRRPSILSASNGTTTAAPTSAPAADVYASDDEENTGAELMSRTLISFDIETADTSDPPESGWSAELRANVADAPQPQVHHNNHNHNHHEPNPASNRQPIYRSNALTRLPAIIAAESFTSSLVKVMLMPFDVPVYRWLVRSFVASRGMSTAGMYAVDELLPWTAFGNFLGIELVHFLVQTEIWAVFYQMASAFMCSEEEWEELEEEEEREAIDR